MPILYGQIAHRVSPSGGVVRDVLRAAGVFSGAVMLVEGGVGFLLTQLQADMTRVVYVGQFGSWSYDFSHVARGQMEHTVRPGVILVIEYLLPPKSAVVAVRAIPPDIRTVAMDMMLNGRQSEIADLLLQHLDPTPTLWERALMEESVRLHSLQLSSATKESDYT